MKNTCPFHIVFLVLKIRLTKISKIEPDLLFLLFLLAFTSADIIFYKFSELQSITTICKKDFCHKFSVLHGFTHIPHPINNENLLNMRKVFCRCSLLTKMTKAEYIKIPEPTECWIQHQRETESNWDRQKLTATKKVLHKIYWKTPVPVSLFQ